MVVEDERDIRELLEFNLVRDGFAARGVESGDAAILEANAHLPELILLDLLLPGIDGLELQRRIKKINPESTIIIMTAYASVESAVEALKQGAYDYITKPFNPDDLSHLVRNAAERKQLVAETSQLRKTLEEVSSVQEIVGQSPAMRKVLELVNIVSST